MEWFVRICKAAFIERSQRTPTSQEMLPPDLWDNKLQDLKNLFEKQDKCSKKGLSVLHNDVLHIGVTAMDSDAAVETLEGVMEAIEYVTKLQVANNNGSQEQKRAVHNMSEHCDSKFDCLWNQAAREASPHAVKDLIGKRVGTHQYQVMGIVALGRPGRFIIHLRSTQTSKTTKDYDVRGDVESSRHNIGQWLGTEGYELESARPWPYQTEYVKLILKE